MAVKTSARSTLTSVAAGSKPRLPGPDVVRALALTGVVVMNYHGYLIIRGGERGSGWAGELFDPWTGPLATRFAATFVLVAGVGITLMTARCRTTGRGIGEMRAGRGHRRSKQAAGTSAQEEHREEGSDLLSIHR